MSRLLLSCAALAVIVGASSCKTSAPMEPEVAAPRSQAGEFKPSQAIAGIASIDARYPDLFAPESFAVWVGPEAMAAKKQESVAAGETIDPSLENAAQVIDQNYYVFECRLESVFSDTSVAYDSVGLRGIDAYLTTPEGYRVPPIQKIIAGRADETQSGALKRFGRTNIIVFAKRDVLSQGPSVAPSSPIVRLVLEGHNSTFYFEWLNGGPQAAPSDPSEFDRIYAGAKLGFNEFYSRLKTLVHVFD